MAEKDRMLDLFDDGDNLTVGGGGPKPKSGRPAYGKDVNPTQQQPPGAYAVGPPKKARHGFD